MPKPKPVPQVSHLAKLTPEAVRKIRVLGKKLPQYILAQRFKVSQTTICAVLRGRVYRKVA